MKEPFRKGDMIHITKECKTPDGLAFFNQGDYAILDHMDSDGDWWAKFLNEKLNTTQLLCVGDNTERNITRFILAPEEDEY